MKRKYIKYMNRKLHEVGSEDAYVSMEDLSKVVMAGDEIEVIDDATGEDLTLATLARILYDRCRMDVETCEPKAIQKILVDAGRRDGGRHDRGKHDRGKKAA